MKNIFKSFIALCSISLSLASFAAAPGDHKKSVEPVNPQALFEAFRDNYWASVEKDPIHREANRRNPQAYKKDLRAQLEIYAKNLIASNPAFQAFFAPAPAGKTETATATGSAAAEPGTDAKSAVAVQQVMQQAQGSNTGSAAAVDNGSAAGSGAMATVDRKQALEKQTVQGNHYVGTSVHVSNDNVYVIVIADGVLTLFDKSTNKPLYSVKGVTSSAAGFSGDNAYIYYEYNNNKKNYVAIYNIAQKQLRIIEGQYPSLSPDEYWLSFSKEVITSERKAVQVRALLSFKTITATSFYGYDGQFSSDSKRFFIINSSEVIAVDLPEAGGALKHFVIPFKDANKIHVNNDGKAIVINDTVLYSLEHKKAFAYEGFTSVKFCANGSIVAQKKDAFQLMSDKGGVEILGTFLDMTYDGRRLLLSRGNKVFQRTVLSGTEELIGEFEMPLCTYTNDGLNVILRSYSAAHAQIISLATKKCLHDLQNITSVRPSPDGSLIAFESRTVVHVFNPKTCQFIGTVEGAFYTFHNNILVTCGEHVGKNRNHYVYDLRAYLCKDLVVHKDFVPKKDVTKE